MTTLKLPVGVGVRLENKEARKAAKQRAAQHAWRQASAVAKAPLKHCPFKGLKG